MNKSNRIYKLCFCIGVAIVFVSFKNDTSKIVGKKWWHLRENDTKNTITYKAEGYNIPASRGREGFILNDKKTATIFNIAPSCGIAPVDAKWKYKNKILMIKSKNNQIAFKIKTITDSTIVGEVSSMVW